MKRIIKVLPKKQPGGKRTKDAVAILKLNTEEFPQSWNVFDSYADTLLKGGQKEAAIKNYRLSHKLNPDNPNAAEQIKIPEH